MDGINTWLAVAQFGLAFVAVPLYRTIKSLESQNSRLEIIITDQQKQIKNQQIQIELLEAIVFETSDAEVVRKHLIRKIDNVRN